MNCTNLVRGIVNFLCRRCICYVVIPLDLFAILAIGASDVHAYLIFGDSGTHNLGPGAFEPVFVGNGTTVNSFEGTQVLPPPTNGSGSRFAWAPDAIAVQDGSHLNVFGGQFHGGDAIYVGNNFGNVASAGDSLFIIGSRAVIHGGEFVGGDGHATNSAGNLRSAHPGNAIFMVGSHVTILDGFFKAGTASRSKPPPTLQGQSIEIFEGSVLEMHGGITEGSMQLDRSATLIVYGSGFLLSDQPGHQTLTGNYANGEAFEHNLLRSFTPRIVTITDNYIRIHSIPEPVSVGLVAPGVLILTFYGRRNRVVFKSSRPLSVMPTGNPTAGTLQACSSTCVSL